MPGTCLQRFTSAQLVTVEFAVKAYDTAGRVSVDYSNVLSICMPEIYPGAPATYQ